MNIGKAIVAVKYDKFNEFILNLYNYMTEQNSLNIREDIDKRDFLFAHFLKLFYKTSVFDTYDHLYKVAQTAKLINDDLLMYFLNLFNTYTKELNGFIDSVLNTKLYDHMMLSNKLLLRDYFQFNCTRVYTDKDFCLKYFSFMPVIDAHVNAIMEAYSDLKQTDEAEITDKDFVYNFYKTLLSNHNTNISGNLLNKNYTIFMMDMFNTKNFFYYLKSNKVFFKANNTIQDILRKKFLEN